MVFHNLGALQSSLTCNIVSAEQFNRKLSDGTVVLEVAGILLGQVIPKNCPGLISVLSSYIENFFCLGKSCISTFFHLVFAL